MDLASKIQKIIDGVMCTKYIGGFVLEIDDDL